MGELDQVGDPRRVVAFSTGEFAVIALCLLTGKAKPLGEHRFEWAASQKDTPIRKR